ncbi:hypothetical protein CS557_12660 [Acinetobacter junii]|nr:hypothetical protein CS557_12660 [Acinetobacter junii]
MKTRLLVGLLFGLSSITLHAEGVDIYPNPNLTDPSLATTFVSKLRAMNVTQMESLIKGECNQFSGYVSLSIQNWNEARKGIKSLNEANDYSQRLITEIPYRQSMLYTFPMGLRIYNNSELYIKTQLENGKNESNLIDEMHDFCLRLNNTKYLNLLSSKEYLVGNQSIFVSQEQLLKKFNPEKSMFKNLKHVTTNEDKLSPKHIEKKVNFTYMDYKIAYSLIDDDIKNSFINSDVRWIDYKFASRNMQKDFATFMKDGGRNKDFAKIVFGVKAISQGIPNYENLDLSDIGKLKLPDKNLSANQEFYISLAQKLNYPISELIK